MAGEDRQAEAIQKALRYQTPYKPHRTGRLQCVQSSYVLRTQIAPLIGAHDDGRVPRGESETT